MCRKRARIRYFQCPVCGVVLTAPKTDDGIVHKLAYDIARKIEAEMKYPGQIKVNVSRETRAMAEAK